MNTCKNDRCAALGSIEPFRMLNWLLTITNLFYFLKKTPLTLHFYVG